MRYGLVLVFTLLAIQQDPGLDGNHRPTGSLPNGTSVPRGAPADYDGTAYADPPTVGAFVP